MDFDFSTLITDRSPSDLELLRDLLSTPMSDWTAEQLAAFNLARSKGAYNYTDLNRVTACMDYLNERLTGYGYATGYQRIEVPHKTQSRLPKGYTELEYIESTGTQYIDTGFKPNQDTRVQMDFQLIGSYSSIRALFGVRDESSGTAPQQFVFWNNGSNSFRTDYFGTQKTISGLTVTDRFIVDKNKNVTTIGEETATNTSANGQCIYNIVLFGINTVGSVSFFSASNLYSCQIYDNGTLIRDFVPCTNASGTVGLYDVVNDEFYQNAGTGTFTAGPNVEAESEEEGEFDPYTWYESDLPTESLMEAYLANVEALRSTLDVLESTPQTPESMEALTWVEANNIEQILLDVQKMINQVVESFSRSNAFTFWSGNRPLPSADSDLGRTWEELDAMNAPWENLETADWFLLAYGNLGVTK